MTIDAINTPKTFDIASNGILVPLAVTRLSLTQLKQRSVATVEKLRQEQRQEFMAAAQLLPVQDRTRFLIEAAKQNVVTSEQVEAAMESVWCLIQTLVVATGKSADELSALYETDPASTERAYLFCLGFDIDAKSEAPAAGDTFPEATNSPA